MKSLALACGWVNVEMSDVNHFAERVTFFAIP